MNKFVTGIDDIGTMSGKSEGWAFISFQKVFLSEFNASAQNILERSGLSSFHGKEFKRRKTNFYTEFLKLIRKTLEKGQSSFICCTLLDEEWKTEFRDFCNSIIGKALRNADIDNDRIVEASKKIAAPLFTYLKIASQRITGDCTSIDIDSDAILKGINDSKLIVEGHQVSSQIPIFASLKAYGRERFPSAPLIEKNTIRILNDEESFLIQAADIFGNFSTALAYKTLGKQSKSNNHKCRIFQQVFGDILDTSFILKNVDLVGDDLVLKQAGSFTLCID